MLNSTEKDKHGRFILIDCVMDMNRIVLVSLYDPHLDDPQFFNSLIQQAKSKVFGRWLNPSMDRSMEN